MAKTEENPEVDPRVGLEVAPEVDPEPPFHPLVEVPMRLRINVSKTQSRHGLIQFQTDDVFDRWILKDLV